MNAAGEKFSQMIAEIAARLEPRRLEISRYTREAREQWVSAWRQENFEATLAALSLAPDIDDIANADMAPALALAAAGALVANVVAEPRYRVSRSHAARDENLGRATMHLAPLWRHPIRGEERGTPALLLPVQNPIGNFAASIPLDDGGEADFADCIADIVALPLDGARPLSMTGYTLAVGSFEPDSSGRLAIFGSGRAWIDAWLAHARAIAADTPPHLVDQLHGPFAGPESVGTLVIEPDALEWRLASAGCVIGAGIREILCPDSRRLAESIDAAMRRKLPARPVPVVRGPKAEARAA